jgi:hypothetical protein
VAESPALVEGEQSVRGSPQQQVGAIAKPNTSLSSQYAGYPIRKMRGRPRIKEYSEGGCQYPEEEQFYNKGKQDVAYRHFLE